MSFLLVKYKIPDEVQLGKLSFPECGMRQEWKGRTSGLFSLVRSAGTERSREWRRTCRVGSKGPKFKSHFCHLPAGWQDNCVHLEFLIGEFGIMVLISQNFCEELSDLKFRRHLTSCLLHGRCSVNLSSLSFPEFKAQPCKLCDPEQVTYLSVPQLPPL